MPMDRSLYPDNWEAIALQVKEEANWTCQECGKACYRPVRTLPPEGRGILSGAHPDEKSYTVWAKDFAWDGGV